jgi:hypothetical protein
MRDVNCFEDYDKDPEYVTRNVKTNLDGQKLLLIIKISFTHKNFETDGVEVLDILKVFPLITILIVSDSDHI